MTSDGARPESPVITGDLRWATLGDLIGAFGRLARTAGALLAARGEATVMLRRRQRRLRVPAQRPGRRSTAGHLLRLRRRRVQELLDADRVPQAPVPGMFQLSGHAKDRSRRTHIRCICRKNRIVKHHRAETSRATSVRATARPFLRALLQALP